MLSPIPSYRSLYTYAWDIADMGVKPFIDQITQWGIHDVSIAASYHAGKFTRPHGQKMGPIVFPEDGVVYFDPDLSRYGEIKPKAHSDATIRSVMRELIDDGRVRVHAWTVLLHNTRIGQANPHLTVRNVFDDSYVYSLCPRQPAVADYAKALVRDLSLQFELHSIILETPGYLPFAHGYHHEFAQLPSNAELDHYLGLCFCPACRQHAREEGIDTHKLMLDVKQHISQLLERGEAKSSTQFYSEYSSAEDALTTSVKAYEKLRNDVVTQLVTEIRQQMDSGAELAVIPSVQRPSHFAWQEGTDIAKLADVVNRFEIPFYESNAEKVAQDADYCLGLIGQEKASSIRAILRPGWPDLNQGEELEQAMAALQARGIHDFAFYNYGLLPMNKLERLGKILTK